MTTKTAKKCSACKTIQPIYHFPRSSNRKDGYGGICKLCLLQRVKASDWKQTRMQILARDNYRCAVCGSNEGGKIEMLHTHHIRGRIEYGDADSNLITLCASCHGKHNPNWSDPRELDPYVPGLKICKRCDYRWISRLEQPKECPRCQSQYWNTEKEDDLAKADISAGQNTGQTII